MERIKYKNSRKLKGLVEKVLVTDGDQVKEGQALAIISTQGEQYQVIAHVDGMIKHVHIIESIVVSHGDIIFDIFDQKDIKRMLLKKNDLSNTLRFSLTKSGYLEDDIRELEQSDVTDDDFDDFDYTREEAKEQTMRFNSIGDNNVNNFHGDIPTDEQFSMTEDDLDFSTNAKPEVASPDESIEINIPASLDNLDDLTIIDNSTLKERTEKKVETEELDLTFKSSDLTNPADIMKDNNVNDENELSFETFVISTTAVTAEQRLRDDEQAMKEALVHAINYDSVTQALDENEIKLVKAKSDDFDALQKDFMLTEGTVSIMDKPKEEAAPVVEEVAAPINNDIDFSSMDSLGNMDGIKASLIKDAPQFDETKTIDLVKRVDAQIESEKSEQPVDISEEAMNKSFEEKMNSNFLSAFNNAASTLQDHNSSDGIYNNMAENMKEISDNKKNEQPSPSKNDDAPVINAEELDRIESLLNIDDFGLDDLEPISVPTPIKTVEVQKEIVREVVTGVPSEDVEKIVSEKTMSLVKDLKNQENEIQELKNKLDEVMSQKPASNGKLTFSNIKNSTCEFTFKTNVTALMNLHSILTDPFSAKGMELSFGTFAALGISKSVAKNNIATEGLSFNFVDGLKFKSIKLNCDAMTTLAEIAKTITEVKSNTKLKTSVSLYDLTGSIVSTANISTDDIMTIVIGKVEETENMTGTLTTKIIFDKNRLTLDDALKFVYEFNALIENPGFLI